MCPEGGRLEPQVQDAGSTAHAGGSPFLVLIALLESRLSSASRMAYWLMKSEPEEVSVDDLARLPRQTTPWFGVRNYQARNFMRDDMRIGDKVFFYHSSCAEPGIAGIAEVSRTAYPDKTQFDAKGKYFDPKATPENPRWVNVDVKLVRKTRLLSLTELRSHPQLSEMRLLQRGNRLSITPVTSKEWNFIVSLL
jgi:predicted RNA-binding protein with PUA-like domain